MASVTLSHSVIEDDNIGVGASSGGLIFSHGDNRFANNTSGEGVTPTPFAPKQATRQAASSAGSSSPSFSSVHPREGAGKLGFANENNGLADAADDVGRTRASDGKKYAARPAFAA
jgi:hypothetical protein